MYHRNLSQILGVAYSPSTPVTGPGKTSRSLQDLSFLGRRKIKAQLKA